VANIFRSLNNSLHCCCFILEIFFFVSFLIFWYFQEEFGNLKLRKNKTEIYFKQKNLNMLKLQLLTVALICFCCRLSHGFYVPGVAPQDFKKGDVVEVRVRRSRESYASETSHFATF
jgi:hypothetical protein